MKFMAIFSHFHFGTVRGYNNHVGLCLGALTWWQTKHLLTNSAISVFIPCHQKCGFISWWQTKHLLTDPVWAKATTTRVFVQPEGWKQGLCPWVSDPIRCSSSQPATPRNPSQWCTDNDDIASPLSTTSKRLQHRFLMSTAIPTSIHSILPSK